MDQGNVQNLPESPASVTARVVTNKGFHILFTVRDLTVSGLMNKLEQFQAQALNKGWKPETKTTQDEKEAVVSGVKGGLSPVKSQEVLCSKCGAKATQKSGYRKDGSLWEGVFCSTGDDSHKVWLN